MTVVVGPATEVIILAQGTQSRLGHAHGLKQLLPLPACDYMPIMGRTAVQCLSFVRSADITLLTWPEVLNGTMPSWTIPRIVTLPDPGNSSLKGISRYLEQSGRIYDDPPTSRSDQPSRTVVLLGDVIYSWACLEAIFRAARGWGFVGTPDLSAGGGEIWGVAWSHNFEGHMIGGLRGAMLRHPPYADNYQPGQLRRWISGSRRGDIIRHSAELRQNGHYIDIADYTHDIDTPDHLTLLPWLSESAADDDRKHGLVWREE